MFCHQCGEEIIENSQFCSHCGARVQVPKDESSTTNEALPLNKQSQESKAETRSKNVQVQKQHRFKRSIPVLIPIISFILVSIGLTIYFFQEKETNAEVLRLKEAAEETSLKGEYKKAEELIKQALSKRPNYSSLTADLKMIEKAIKYEKVIAQVSENIKKTQFDEAAKELASLKEKLNEEQSPLFEPFHKQIEQKEIKITIGTIKKELNDLITIDQLGGKLSILASLPEEEASAVKQEIINKIIQISTDEVEDALANKQFSDAFSIVENGLQYAADNEKLLALKSRIEQDQTAFEQAEQDRIEKAMESAAQEDLKNRTAAVEVSDFTTEVSEYGDLFITGSVKNVATTDISSITIYYTIYDVNHNYLDEGYTSVYPYYLEVGEVGLFEDIYYGVYQNVNVEIDNITWYLN